jgi:anti-sigma factor RsiW
MPKAPNKETLIAPHLADTQLVAYLDGELSRGEMETGRSHIESCWSCRSRAGEIGASIGRFLQARQSIQPEVHDEAEARISQFRNRLALHAAAGDSVRAGLLDQFKGWWSRPMAVFSQYRRPILAAAVAGCLLLVMFSDSFNTRVSADTVLSRVDGYEQAHRPQPGRVNHVTIRAEKITRATHSTVAMGTINLVEDSATPVTYVSATLPSGKVLTDASADAGNVGAVLLAAVLPGADQGLIEYLQKERFVPDVSAAGFHRLISNRGSNDEAMQRQGDDFELRYPFSAGHASGIREATLTVHAGDYSPVSLAIDSETEEYRFERVAFASEERSTQVARLFAADLPRASATRAEAQLPVHRPTPLSYLNTRASESEVMLSAALHQVDSCLGEEVYVFPMSDGSLLVQGLVDSVARRNAIREALRRQDPHGDAPAVRVEVFVPRELKNGSELFLPPDRFDEKPPEFANSRSATLAELSSAQIPLYQQLHEHFAKPGSSEEETNRQVAIFSSEIVTLARQSFLHAWALKRLDREFSTERVAGLPASAREKIEQMRQDHRRWIATLARRQAEMLAGISGAAAGVAQEQIAVGSVDSQTLLRLAQEQNDLVRSLFTTSQAAPEPDRRLAHLLAVLRQMGS